MLNYSEAEYYKAAMKGGAGPKGAGGPRVPKMPVLQDYQFFNVRTGRAGCGEVNSHVCGLGARARDARAAGLPVLQRETRGGGEGVTKCIDIEVLHRSDQSGRVYDGGEGAVPCFCGVGARVQDARAATCGQGWASGASSGVWGFASIPGIAGVAALR